MHDLIRAWREFGQSAPPYILEGDKEELLQRPDAFCVYNNWNSYLESGENDRPLSENRFHLGLLPQPFFGPVATAKVYVLMLNPGFMPLDYFAEEASTEFRRAMADNYRTATMPHLLLDPRFAWHGGYAWWMKRLRKTISSIAKKNGDGFRDTLRMVACSIAALELIPYHSQAFSRWGIITKLKSARLARAFVHEVALPRARKDECRIIVARQARAWGVQEERNVIVYRGGENRGAWLGPETRGGKAILDML